MLIINSISKSFIRRGLVLDNLDLTVKKGDSLAITGPSGSGKTTLMNIIGLLDRPDSGEIFFDGKSILSFNSDEAALHRNKNIGFVFQDHLLLPHLTIRENIFVPLFASNVSKDDFEIKSRYGDHLMEITGITDLADKHPFQISGGEAQRATVVRALINKPFLLLADEPTGSLDTKNAETLGDLLVKLNLETGTALIVATHSPDLAGKMQLHLKLREGKLVKE